MRTQNDRDQARRVALTLVEMLVVMSLVALLAALVVAFVPRLQEHQKANRGAEQLQGWLLIAKQWAKRDGVPTGLRLSPGVSGLCTSLQYIQQPDVSIHRAAC